VRKQNTNAAFSRATATYRTCLGFTFLVYLFAVWNHIEAYLAEASSEQIGWLVVLFPVLFLPALLPWLALAVPISVGFAISHPGKVFVLIGCFLLTFQIDISSIAYFSREFGGADRATADIGNISPILFKVGIWIMAGLGAFLSHRKHNSSTG
jgi:hypothetical protein